MVPHTKNKQTNKQNKNMHHRKEKIRAMCCAKWSYLTNFWECFHLPTHFKISPSKMLYEVRVCLCLHPSCRKRWMRCQIMVTLVELYNLGHNNCLTLLFAVFYFCLFVLHQMAQSTQSHIHTSTPSKIFVTCNMTLLFWAWNIVTSPLFTLKWLHWPSSYSYNRSITRPKTIPLFSNDKPNICSSKHQSTWLTVHMPTSRPHHGSYNCIAPIHTPHPPIQYSLSVLSYQDFWCHNLIVGSISYAGISYVIWV